MVCKNEQSHIAIRWDETTIYGFVIDPTEYECRLAEAVNDLPTICRKTVILFAFESISREEIAVILQTSLAAVRFLIHRSGLLMREGLAEYGKQNVADLKLSRLFSNWPYREYAELIKLRKSLMFLK